MAPRHGVQFVCGKKVCKGLRSGNSEGELWGWAFVSWRRMQGVTSTMGALRRDIAAFPREAWRSCDTILAPRMRSSSFLSSGCFTGGRFRSSAVACAAANDPGSSLSKNSLRRPITRLARVRLELELLKTDP